MKHDLRWLEIEEQERTKMKSLKQVTNEYVKAYGMVRSEAEKKAKKDLKFLQDMEQMVLDLSVKLKARKTQKVSGF